MCCQIGGVEDGHPPSRLDAGLAAALATAEQFNSCESSGKRAWFWSTIAPALVTNHYWLGIASDSCQAITEMRLSMKPCDPDAPIRVAIDDVRLPTHRRHFGECDPIDCDSVLMLRAGGLRRQARQCDRSTRSMPMGARPSASIIQGPPSVIMGDLLSTGQTISRLSRDDRRSDRDADI
jgi:hypothetical protein